MKADLRNRLGWPSKKVVPVAHVPRMVMVKDLPGWYVESLIAQWRAVDRAGAIFEIFVNNKLGVMKSASVEHNNICVLWS